MGTSKAGVTAGPGCGGGAGRQGLRMRQCPCSGSDGTGWGVGAHGGRGGTTQEKGGGVSNRVGSEAQGVQAGVCLAQGLGVKLGKTAPT